MGSQYSSTPVLQYFSYPRISYRFRGFTTSRDQGSTCRLCLAPLGSQGSVGPFGVTVCGSFQRIIDYCHDRLFLLPCTPVAATVLATTRIAFKLCVGV